MAIHQGATFPVAPERVYEWLTDGAKFAAATDLTVEIEADDGGEFSNFSCHIEAGHVELVPGQMIVQDGRGRDSEAGVCSLARDTSSREGEDAQLLLDQDAYPESESPMYSIWREHLLTNWPEFYFEPFANYVGNNMALL